MAVLRASVGADPDRAGLGDAVARNGGQYRARALPPGASAAPPRARRRCPRSNCSTCGASGCRAGRFLAPPLVEAAARTLAAGEQALLFLNRRGYAPLTLCRACGHRMQCPSCTAWLVEHRFTGRLQCHHCGHAEPVPALCPECLASRQPGAVRARGRAAQGGGRGALSRSADRADGQRSADRAARRCRAGRGDRPRIATTC